MRLYTMRPVRLGNESSKFKKKLKVHSDKKRFISCGIPYMYSVSSINVPLIVTEKLHVVKLPRPLVRGCERRRYFHLEIRLHPSR